MASFVSPEYDAGARHGTRRDPHGVEQALRHERHARVAFIVSPTYYGMAADVQGCAEGAHGAGVALVVDNAWGAHFGFHA